MNPKVSVIVPVYGAEAFLPTCISSLRAQTLRDIELIVRDIIATLNVGLMLEDTETPTQVSIGCCIGYRLT